MRQVQVTRQTKETEISCTLGLAEGGQPGSVDISTGVPFFDHMLTSCAFHGGLNLTLRADGDLAVDAHHTVEDVGIVLGGALLEIVTQFGPVGRFGHGIVPMDDALGEVVVDAGGRAYLVWDVTFPQPYAGTFDLALVREFMQGLASGARINLHVMSRAGVNGHHVAEALFKSLGRALRQAYSEAPSVQSTKGTL